MVAQTTFSNLRTGAGSVKARTIQTVRSRLRFPRSVGIGLTLFIMPTLTECNLPRGEST